MTKLKEFRGHSSRVLHLAKVRGMGETAWIAHISPESSPLSLSLLAKVRVMGETAWIAHI